MQFGIQIIPVAFLVCAAISDIRIKKIKNFITYPMILSGLLFSLYFIGTTGFMEAFKSMILGAALLNCPGFRSGGGDIKLGAACGAWLGTINLTLGFIFFALLLSWVVLTVRTLQKQGFLNMLNILKLEYYSQGQATQQGSHIPMAPMLFIGYIAAFLMR